MSRVALIGENSVGYVNALLDIWNNGDAAVLIDWRIPISSAIEMMNEAGVTECYIENSVYEKYNPLKAENIVFKILQRESNIPLLLPKTIHNKFQINYSKDEAVILYSSGTTGKSKGIILSHYAINTNADAIMDYMNLTKNDCMYIVKSLCHSSTLTGELLIALKFNIPIVIAPTIVPPRKIFDNIQKFKVTTLCVNPTILRLLADERSKKNHSIDTLRTIYVSGSILNDNIRYIADDSFFGINIFNVYGLSEAGPRVTAQRIGCNKSNSVGKPILDVEIAITDDFGNPLPCKEYGNIYVKTKSEYIGYVSGKEKFNRKYKNWLNTGDIGYLDDNNELHIVGRKDDLIIIDSHKIYPSEVEKALLDIQETTECVITSIQYKGQMCLGCLYVGKINEFLLRKKLFKHLPTYEIPKLIIKTNAIPKNRNGKILKSEVISILEKNIESD